MKKEIWGVLTAFLAGVAATTCCLPPLLFLLFGVSFGFLSFLEHLTPFRVPLSILSLGILWFSWRQFQQRKCTCNRFERRKYLLFYGLSLSLLLIVLLYPELANFLLGGEE